MSNASPSPRRAHRPRRHLILAAAGGLALAGTVVGVEAAQAASVHTVKATAKVKEVKQLRNDRSRYVGKARGAPFGKGTMVLIGRMVPANRAKKTRARISASFTLTTPKGVVKGTGIGPLKIRGGRFVFSGPARITKGTGRYAKIRSAGVRFSGSVASLREITVRLQGKVRY